jgi:hypothetical protein
MMLSPVAGVGVSVCTPNNGDCAGNPLRTGSTDAVGRVLLQVPQTTTANQSGLNGYFQLASPTIVTELWYWGFPVTRANVSLTDDPNAGGHAGIRVFTAAGLDADYQAFNVARDSTRGTLIALVLDCLGQPAPGVAVTIDKTDKGIIPSYGNPPSASETQTDTSGIASFGNVPVGSVTLTATPVVLGKPASRVTVLVKPNAITWAWPYPTP